MNLEQFDLDLPYIPNEYNISSIMNEKNCLYDEATQMDYEANWKEKRRKFSLETRNISAMFERLINEMKTKDCWKILIECVDCVKEKRVLNFSGVYTIQVKFSYDNFSTSDDYGKKQKALELILEGTKIIAKSEGWNFQPFETAFSKICEANYINEWVWKKTVKSIDKKNSAEVLCQHGVNSIEIYIVIRDKFGTETDRKKVISELPHEFAYAKHLGELKWISNNEIALVNKKGDNSWKVMMEN